MTNVTAATLELIDRYAPDIDVPPPVVLEQARRNLALRIHLLQEFGAVDSRELAELAGSKARNPASTVDNWRRAHRWRSGPSEYSVPSSTGSDRSSSPVCSI